MRRPAALALLVAAALLPLAGCGAEPGAPKVEAEVGVPSPSWAATVTSATVLVRGPATADPAGGTAWSRDVPADVTVVTVRYALTGAGVASAWPQAGLLTGADGRTADEETGWMGDDRTRDARPPTTVPAGATSTTWSSWRVPSDALGSLTLTLTGQDGAATLPVAVS